MSVTLYSEALQELDTAFSLRSKEGHVRPLQTARWSAPLDAVDESVVDRLDGATIDIGCGPGRFVTGIAERGLPVLGIDIAPAAVELTRRRGGLALRRDVFDTVPGSGRWRWALLLDGNIGIGGAPARLLRRTAELLDREGRILVEVEAPGGLTGTSHVRIESPSQVGRWFPWAWVPVEGLPALASESALQVMGTWDEGGRWFGELARV